MTQTIDTVIFDLDGTILRQLKGAAALNCPPGTWIDVWRQFFSAAGLVEECRHLTIKYQDSLTNSMTPEGHREFFHKSCELLKRKQAAPVLETFQELPYTPGFFDFCRYLREQGVKTGIVTLSLDAIAQQIKRKAGLDFAVGNEIYLQGDLFTGTGKINVPFGGKGQAVERAYASLGAGRETTAFFGDSGNDVDCWKAVDFPFGMNIDDPYRYLVQANFPDFHQAKEYFQQRQLLTGK